MPAPFSPFEYLDQEYLFEVCFGLVDHYQEYLVFLIILTTWCCLTRSTSRTVISIRSRSTCSTSSALSSLVVLIWSICSRILISARFRCSTLVRSSNPSVVISTWFSLVFITSLVLIRRRRYSSACTIFTV